MPLERNAKRSGRKTQTKQKKNIERKVAKTLDNITKIPRKPKQHVWTRMVRCITMLSAMQCRHPGLLKTLVSVHCGQTLLGVGPVCVQRMRSGVLL